MEMMHLTQIQSLFRENYMYVNLTFFKILLFSLLMKRWSGSDRRHDYSYDFYISYLNIVTLSSKIIHQSKFYTKIFWPQYSSTNHL
jgi:hypothetical protein